MVLATSGHAAIAAAVKANDIHLAWGDLPPFLGAPTGVTGTSQAGTSTVEIATHEYVVTTVNEFGESIQSDVITVVVAASDRVVNLSWTPVTYATGYKVYKKVGVEYQLLDTAATASYNDNGSVIPNDTQPPVADTTSITPWTTTPPAPNLEHTKLYREVGRRKVMMSKFVVPDVSGAYVTTNGRWSEVGYPTPYLYLYIGYDLTDAQTATIYQLGLFLGTVPSAGNEAKIYLLPSEIDEEGDLLSLEHVSPIYRNSSTREIHEIVITF